MPQIVFLTFFLGLTRGPANVALQVDPAIASIRLELGGRTVATMNQAPWTTVIDFGSELVPMELVAIGFDARGNQLARAAQMINLPRAMAEVEILVKTRDGLPVRAELVGRHRRQSAPKEAILTIDGTAVRTTNFAAQLPDLDWTHPHVLSATMRFEDGEIAQRETIIAGGLGETISAQVTPVLMTAEKNVPPKLDGCFAVDGVALHSTAIEKKDALVMFVKDTNAMSIRSRPSRVLQPEWWFRPRRTDMQLDRHTTLRVLWPVAKKFSGAASQSPYLLFDGDEVQAVNGGIPWLLTQSNAALASPSFARRFTDAVAVAGLEAFESGRRRAVVLLLEKKPDASQHTPAIVRRYLERIGVPLFVWSIDAPTADQIDSWGTIADISTPGKLNQAVGELDRTLQAQRIAWIAVDPLASLRVVPGRDCGLKPVARDVIAPAVNPRPSS
jgi:hypothetical protein